MIISACMDAPIPPRVLDPLALNALYKIGFRAVRYPIDGARVIKARDAYDLASITADLRTIRNAGMYAYANWTYVPSFMSEGAPAYVPYQAWVSDPATSAADLIWAGPDGSRWRMATRIERPYMYLPNIPHIDAQLVEAFGYALASECSDLIDQVGSWNEPGGSAYWPPVQAPPYEVAYARLFDEVLAPFARGYRRGCTGGMATFIGPEADVESAISFLCQLEQDRGYRVFDALSFHPYSWGSPFVEKAMARSDEFMATARRWAHGRPILGTEAWDYVTGGSGQMPEVFRASAEKYPDLRMQTMYEPQSLFIGGKPAFDRGEFALNDQGKRMQTWIEGAGNSRRRAVNK